ncbi:MAG TPA: HAD-IA family hydrolase [Candidatus Nanoarchaeia archaeon]|nr:HAD-IA family hydrolase [Candidatus Nanoarchaeia archaeon]
MIEAIIFDFGDVIYRVDNNKIIKNLSKFTDTPEKELKAAIYQEHAISREYENGLITFDQFFQEIVRKGSLKITPDEFIKAYCDKFTVMKPTLELIKRLKEEEYSLGLISNADELDFEYAIKTCEIFPLFDAVSLSFEVKEMKPNEKMFRDSLRKLGKRPEECVYIDNIKEFADASSRLGIHGIHYTGYSQLIGTLRDLEVRI